MLNCSKSTSLVISPETRIIDLVDRGRLEAALEQHPVGDPYREVLLRIDSPKSRVAKTVDDYRVYLGRLANKPCGAPHEQTNCEFGANQCPIRDRTIPCLHGLDTRYIGQDRSRGGKGLFAGENRWVIRAFALAYMLREKGFDVPRFVHQYQEYSDLLEEKDSEAQKTYIDWFMSQGFNRGKKIPLDDEILAFQRHIGQKFESLYIAPIRSAFHVFWNENVDAEPIDLAA